MSTSQVWFFCLVFIIWGLFACGFWFIFAITSPFILLFLSIWAHEKFVRWWATLWEPTDKT